MRTPITDDYRYHVEELLIWAYQQGYAHAEKALNKYCFAHSMEWKIVQPRYNLIEIRSTE